MSMLMMLSTAQGDEDALIDSTGNPDTVFVVGGQTPAPFNDNVAASLADRAFLYLPDPTIGGRPAPGNVNGANPGPVGQWRDAHPTTADVFGWMPPITQQMHGNVGRSNLAARQYAGVLDQLSNQSFSPLQSAAALVGLPYPNALKPES